MTPLLAIGRYFMVWDRNLSHARREVECALHPVRQVSTWTSASRGLRSSAVRVACKELTRFAVCRIRNRGGSTSAVTSS